MKKNLIDIIKIISLSLIVVLGFSYLYAWTGPSGQPPLNNTPAPLNVGYGTQIRQGNLTINGLLSSSSAAAIGLLVNNGKVLADDFCIKNADGTPSATCLSSGGGNGAGGAVGGYKYCDHNDGSSPGCNVNTSVPIACSDSNFSSVLYPAVGSYVASGHGIYWFGENTGGWKIHYGNIGATSDCNKVLMLTPGGGTSGVASWTAMDLNDKSPFDVSCHYYAAVGGIPHVDFSFVGTNVISEYSSNDAFSIVATNKKVEANNGYVVSALYKSCAGSGGASSGGWKSVNLNDTTTKFNLNCYYYYLNGTGSDVGRVTPQTSTAETLNNNVAGAYVQYTDKKTQRSAVNTSPVTAIYESCPPGITGIGQ